MKEFHVNPFKSLQFYYIFVLLYFQIKIIPMFSIHKEYWWVPASMITMFTFLQFLMYQSVNIKIYIEDDLITIKQIGTPLQKIKWQDITKIRKCYLFLAPGNCYYEISTNKKKYWFPEAFENIDELLTIIEEKTGKTTKGEFSFDKD